MGWVLLWCLQALADPQCVVFYFFEHSQIPILPLGASKKRCREAQDARGGCSHAGQVRAVPSAGSF